MLLCTFQEAFLVPFQLIDDWRPVAGTGAVCGTLAWAPGVLFALVPALAVWHLVGSLAGEGRGVKHLPLGAPELVGVFAEEAGEEELAVCGVGQDRVGLQDALGPDDLLARAPEPVNLFEAGLRVLADPSVALLGLGRGLFGPDTGAHRHVEDEGKGAWHLVGGAVVTRVEPVADVRALVVEQTVGTVATVVDPSLAGLRKTPATLLIGKGHISENVIE